jgi:hypothetical protein
VAQERSLGMKDWVSSGAKEIFIAQNYIKIKRGTHYRLLFRVVVKYIN